MKAITSKNMFAWITTATLCLVALGTFTMATAEEPQNQEPLDPETTDWSKVDWKSRLTAEQYKVTRKAGTEKPFKNEYWDNKRKGIYQCICCGVPLYSSEAKYKSGTGWPSFYQPLSKKAVSEHEDRSWFSVRTEIRCSLCDAHIGHVFEDGPEPTGLRYCMNSAAMKFVPAEEAETGEEKAGE